MRPSRLAVAPPTQPPPPKCNPEEEEEEEEEANREGGSEANKLRFAPSDNLVADKE